mgnify:CR=1 FL=1
MIKVLAIGDTVGEPGRAILSKWIPRLREEERLAQEHTADLFPQRIHIAQYLDV